MNVIGDLTKEVEGTCLTPLLCENTARRCFLWTRKLALTRHELCQSLDLGHARLQTVRNRFLLFISNPVYDIWLQQPEWTKKYNQPVLVRSQSYLSENIDSSYLALHLLILVLFKEIISTGIGVKELRFCKFWEVEQKNGVCSKKCHCSLCLKMAISSNKCAAIQQLRVTWFGSNL